MQKKFIVMAILGCLLLSGCGYASADIPEHSKALSAGATKTAVLFSKPIIITATDPAAVPTPAATPVFTQAPAPTAVKKVCTECGGTGKCARCGGDGVGFYDMPCNFCQGGNCLNCGGKGYLILEPEHTPAPGACPVCGGTGICNVCGGLGHYHSITPYGDEEIECNSCHGTGDCEYCDTPGID